MILFFIGFSLLLSNLAGVPASTSMTAVGAIAGLGIATDSLNWELMGMIMSWWLVAPAVAFLAGGIIGRYVYVHLDAVFPVDSSTGDLLRTSFSRRPVKLGENTTRGELVGSLFVVLIASYMAFSAGASNVANAVAPLIGSGMVEPNAGIILAAVAMSMGGFTVARKTLDTVGSGITDMPLMAALVVSTVSASIITVLSYLGIPASLAISATMCITGLGWGRASRTVKVADTLQGEKPKMKAAALQKEEKESIGEESSKDIPDTTLFDPETVHHVVTLWILTPLISAVLSYTVFVLITFLL